MSSAPEAIWRDPKALVDFYYDTDIPGHPEPGFLVLSIIVSILGSYATLLLLGRRSSNKGLRNFGFLIVSAICFAAVAVWGMHFVSMISVRLDPSPYISWAIVFSPGMTALSLFVPLIATICAFWFLGDDPSYVADKDDSWKAALAPKNLLESWRILAGGIFLGLTIGLMHYSASFQLPNFNVAYTAITVVFALILACVAATAALALFFRARQQWQESFWKRGVCSLFLAAAVCGMHYLGLGGTSYRTRWNISPDQLASNGQNTRLIIAISVMCGVIILISVLLAVLDYRTRVQMKAKAKNIVLASVAFDDNGKILVKPDGTIPMQIMQTDTNSQNLANLLDPRLSSFQWLYQMSFCWKTAVVPHVPRIVNNKGIAKGTFADPALVGTVAGKEALEKVSFRSRFIEAAVLLAHSLDLSVESIGILFDRVLTTGTKVFDQQEQAEKFMPMPSDDESSIHGITMKLGSSEGVMCFLARELGNGKPAAHDMGIEHDPHKEIDTVDYYLERGWRLAETRFFSKLLADYMGVSKAEMDVFLNACKTYAKRGALPVVQEGGVYLGLFGVRPTGASDGGLDVLVYNFARHQIPAYRLPDIEMPLNNRTLAWLKSCHNVTMHELLDRCNETLNEADSSSRGSNRDSAEVDEQEVFYDFLAALCVSLESLTTAMRVWPTLTHQARLSPEIIELPCSDDDSKRPAQMLLLSVILPAPEQKLTPVQTRASGIQVPNLETSRNNSDKPPAPFVYSPWNLFCRSQTMILKGGVYRDVSKNLSQEIGKMYLRQANDLAAEIAASDKRTTTNSGPDAANPFVDAAAAKGRGRHARRTSNAEQALDEKLAHPQSIAGDSMLNLAASPHTPGKKKRTTASVNEQGLKGAIQTLVGGRKEGVLSEEELSDFSRPAGASGAEQYAHVRTRADMWFVRVMQRLAEADETEQKYLEYTDWESQCKILPLN